VIGKVIAGRYKLTAQLGQGGMGSVWKAEHLTLGSPVAIKLIEEKIAGNADVLARFEREAQAAAALRSPHVVQILDYGVDDKTPFIAMELLEGESLASRLEKVGRMSSEQLVRVLTQVARAIGKAHEAGITHRDLKPDNIFLVKNDDDEVAKVLDFGIAKTQTPGISSGTKTGTMMGTPYYMSPEQAQGTKQIDARTDTWALGVIAFECLCGHPPFMSDALGDLVLQICVKPQPVPSTICRVPAGFDAWFARAVNRDVDRRFQTAKEPADALRFALLEDPSRQREAVVDTILGVGPPASSPEAPRKPAPKDALVGDTIQVGGFSDASILPAAAGNLGTFGSSAREPSGRRGVMIAACILVALGVVGAIAFTQRGSASPEAASSASASIAVAPPPPPTMTTSTAMQTMPPVLTAPVAEPASPPKLASSPATKPASAVAPGAATKTTRPAPAAAPARPAAMPTKEDRVGF